MTVRRENRRFDSGLGKLYKLLTTASGGHDAHADVDGPRGMGECADGNVIDASVGVRANILEGDASGGFEWNAAAVGREASDCGANHFRCHVVEEDGLGA